MPSKDDTNTKKSGAPDLVQRGKYSFDFVGGAMFVGLRAFDIYFQYQILAGGLGGFGEAFLSRLGIPSIPVDGHPPSDYLPVSTTTTNLPLSRLILVALDAGGSLKQVFWLLCVSREAFSPKAALVVSTYNTLVNTLGSLLLLSAPTSSALATPRVAVPGFPGLEVSLPTVVGVAMYAVGIAVETVAEVQRKRFKDAPENKGKIYTKGLWGLARHINFGGYTLWRAGCFFAAGGWAAGGAMLVWQAFTFFQQGIPNLDHYMTKRYRPQWEQYKKDVKWALIPGIC